MDRPDVSPIVYTQPVECSSRRQRLLQNATLVDATWPSRARAPSLIEDGIIRDVTAESSSLTGDRQVIDLRGRTVVPGLIDAPSM